MMFSDDDDEEPQLKVVDNYHFLDGKDEAVSFSVLPLQFGDNNEVVSPKKDVFLLGFADGGLQKVHKKVVAWKLGLHSERPEIAVLSKEGSWIHLLKPRKCYETTVRTILITVQMLHFLRRNPAKSVQRLRDHLCEVFDKFEVRPSNDDFRKHRSLIKLFAKKDSTLAKSQILGWFIKDKSGSKIDEAILNNMGTKQPFIVGDEEINEMVASGNDDDDTSDCDNSNGEGGSGEDDTSSTDSVCAICDNGGVLLGCNGPCKRSFHPKIKDGEESKCETLGYTAAQVKEIKTFLCKNCEYRQHQCFVCGELEPSDGPSAKVFLCNKTSCGHFYHPKCVAPLLLPNNMNGASKLDKRIAIGMSFTCPIHWCFKCQSLEVRTQEEWQFAVCRRCPRSYHMKCLPREISFEEIKDNGSITRAWKLSDRIVIYCLDHNMCRDIGTPRRDHIKFPCTPKIEKAEDFLENKVVINKKKKRTSQDLCIDQPSKKPGKTKAMRVKDEPPTEPSMAGFAATASILEPVDEQPKKKPSHVQEGSQPEPSMAVAAAAASSLKHVDEQEKAAATTASSPDSVNEQEKPLIVESAAPASSPEPVNVQEKLFVVEFEAPASPESMNEQGKPLMAESAAVASSPESVNEQEKHFGTLSSLNSKRMPQGSFPVVEIETKKRIGTLVEKATSCMAFQDMPSVQTCSSINKITTDGSLEYSVQIADKLHWYVQPGDTIVDICCGANNFSRLMKKKLDEVGKICSFKNYDLIQPKSDFCFEKRDWMTVEPKELPQGSQLIMCFNPPVGVGKALANKLMDKALTFKPKLIMLLVPERTGRLARKETYDLIWVDNRSLPVKSYYLPCPVDVNEKDEQKDGWNASPPSLSLWSCPEKSEEHKRIAEKHGHTSIARSAFQGKQGGDNELHNLLVGNNCGAAYEQNLRSGEENETRTGESMAKQDMRSGRDEINGKESKSPGARSNEVDGLPRKHQMRIAYEERNIIPNRNDTHQEGERDVRHGAGSHAERHGSNENPRAAEILDEKSRKRRESNKTIATEDDLKVKLDSNRKRTHPKDARNSQQEDGKATGQQDLKSPQHHDSHKVPEASNDMSRKRGESNSIAEVADDMKADSGRNTSPWGTSKSQKKSLSRSQCRQARSFWRWEKAYYQNRYSRTYNGCRAAPILQGNSAFSAGGGGRHHYGPPSSRRAGGSYCWRRLEDRPRNYIMNRRNNAHRNSFTDGYGAYGHQPGMDLMMHCDYSRDDYPQMDWTLSVEDARLSGGWNAERGWRADYQQNRYFFG